MNEPAINVSPETPQSLREVGIYLGQIIKSAEERKQIEAKHHEENKSSIATVIKRIDDLRENYPTRTEFAQAIQELKDENMDKETRVRKLEYWGAIAFGGLIVLDAVIAYYLAFRK